MAQRSGLTPMRQLPTSQKPILSRVNSAPLSFTSLHTPSSPTNSTNALDDSILERVTRTLKRTRRIVSDPPLTPPAHSRPTSATINPSIELDNVLEQLVVRSPHRVSQPKALPSQELPTPDTTPPSLKSQLSMLRRPHKIERDISLTSVTASFVTAPEYVSSNDIDEDNLVTMNSVRRSENTSPTRSLPRVGGVPCTMTQQGSTSTQESKSPESTTGDDEPDQVRVSPKSSLSHMLASVSVRARYTADAHYLKTKRQAKPDLLDTLVDTEPIKMEHMDPVRFPKKVDNLDPLIRDQDILARLPSGRLDTATKVHHGRSITDDLKRLSSVRESRHTIEAIIVELQPQPPRQLRHTRKNSRLRDEKRDSEDIQQSTGSEIMLHRLSHRRKSHDLRRHSLGMTGLSSISSDHSHNYSVLQNLHDKPLPSEDSSNSNQHLNNLEQTQLRGSMENSPSLQLENTKRGQGRSHSNIYPQSLTVISAPPASDENPHRRRTSSLFDKTQDVYTWPISSRHVPRSRNDTIESEAQQLSSFRMLANQTDPEDHNDIHDVDNSFMSPHVLLVDESKLHPFWRPAQFWDDVMEEYEDANTHGIKAAGRNSSVSQRRFSLKRTFAVSPIQDNSMHRHDSHAKVLQRSHSGKSSTMRYQSSVESIESSRDRKADQQARTRCVSLWDRWHGLGRRLNEGRRRRRVLHLKKTIGVPIIANREKLGFAPVETRYKVG